MQDPTPAGSIEKFVDIFMHFLAARGRVATGGHLEFLTFIFGGLFFFFQTEMVTTWLNVRLGLVYGFFLFIFF